MYCILYDKLGQQYIMCVFNKFSNVHVLIYNEVPNIKTIFNNIKTFWKMFYLFSKLIIVMYTALKVIKYYSNQN